MSVFPSHVQGLKNATITQSLSQLDSMKKYLALKAHI